MHCLYGGYNLHRFSDALGLVFFVFSNFIVAFFLQQIYRHGYTQNNKRNNKNRKGYSFIKKILN